MTNTLAYTCTEYFTALKAPDLWIYEKSEKFGAPGLLTYFEKFINEIGVYPRSQSY